MSVSLNEVLKYEIFLKNNNASYFAKIKHVFYQKIDSQCVLYFRLAKICMQKRIPFFHLIFMNKVIIKFNCFLSLNSEIGLGLKLPHPSGIVIGQGVKIGKNCTIYQQTTIGGREIGDGRKNNYPTIGDNVIIFAGAKIIGKVSIGNNVIIGANSVVNKDIPNNNTVAGVPARII